MTTPQNPYGPQARPAQPYSPSFPQTGPQGPQARHSAPGQQWGGAPQQGYQPPMSAGFAQQGPAGYAPQSRAPQSFASAPAGNAPSGSAGVPGQRSGEYGVPQYPSGGQQPPPQQPKNGFGVTALVLGILGVLFAWIPIIGVIAWPLVILGLIFGIIGIVRARSGKANNAGVAISGTVLSAIGLIICIFWVAAIGSAASSAPTTTGSLPASTGTTGTTTAAGAFPGSTSDDVVGNAGDTLTVGDMQIAATPLTAGDSTLGKTLCSTVTYTNTGSSPAQFNGLVDWKLQDPSGAALMTGFTGSSNILSAGDLAPGGTTTGDMCFDQNASASGQYVLLYKPMLSFSSARGAWLNQVG